VYAGALSYWPSNIYRSTNGGSSWTALNPNSHRNDSSAPYASSQTVHWLSDLEIDPFNNNVAIFNTGYGLYRTTNLTAATPTWSFFNDGFEQVADLELNSPNTGTVHLLSAIGDRDGYRHDDFSQSPSIGLFGQRNGLAEGTNDDVDSAFNDSNYVVRLTRVSPYVQVSSNNGIDWAWLSSSNSSGDGGSTGNVAISADGVKVVFEPSGTGTVRYSTRTGSTWSAWTTPASGTPANGAEIVADLVASQTFYAYVGTTVSRSTDGGANWTVMTTSAPSGGGWIRALPGQTGHLVMSRGSNGVWRTTNGGATWSQLANGVVTTANQVGVGMGPTSGSYPSIFVGGTVNGQNGFFRSDDQGATWVEISDLAHQYGWVTVIQGDPRVYGRLYVGTNGRGILYADIHTPQTYLPAGWSTQDIGSPGSTGSAGSPTDGTWELIGGGAGIGGTSDKFRFAYASITGDGSITARVMGVPSDNPANHNAKAGIMIRDGVGAGAANVLLAMSPGSVNGAFFQYRSTSGGTTTTNINPGIWSPYWVRLTRSGNTFTAYCSADGENWSLVGTATVAMGATVNIGLAVTASDNNLVNISTFQNVTVATVNATIAGRMIFYNNSKFDSTSDDNAIATDKQALLPGGTATFANYTSYSRGINGIMIDIQNLANPGALNSEDFQFKVGNDNNPYGLGWSEVTAACTVSVRQDQGAGGSDRVTITWDNGAILNQWLQVTVLVTANTGLAEDDVFYFGNAVGESGDNPANAVVDLQDEIASRTHKTGFSSAAITSFYDYNRDAKVNATDDLIARGNVSGPELQLINLTVGMPLAVENDLQPLDSSMGETTALQPSVMAETITSLPTYSETAQLINDPHPESGNQFTKGDALPTVKRTSMPELGDAISLNVFRQLGLFDHHLLFPQLTVVRPVNIVDVQTIPAFRDNAAKNLTIRERYSLHDDVFAHSLKWNSFTERNIDQDSLALSDIDAIVNSYSLDKAEQSLVQAIDAVVSSARFLM
jgi:hypothetical protein